MANKNVLQRIEILKSVKPRNLILWGEEGETLGCIAHEIASTWLKTDIEDLPFHPDFKEIEAQNGVIRSEQAEIIKKMSGYKPQSEKAVCVVKDAELMTTELQNKLLKVLEDGENVLAVIFITKKHLLDTVCSRCLTLEFAKTPLSEIAGMRDYQHLPVLLACDGSLELYDKIVADEWFFQYIEGFFSSFCKMKDRGELKYLLRLTHALKEKDKEYLPEYLEDWQMNAFISMIKKMFYYLICEKHGVSIPPFVRLGKLPELYKLEEAFCVYEKAMEAEKANHKKGQFSKNDFFELLTFMIPLD